MRCRRLVWFATGLLFFGIVWQFSFRPVQQPSTSVPGLWSANPSRSPGKDREPAAPSLDRRFPLRLSNTTKSLEQLVGDARAILLENAFIDTAAPLNLGIPRLLTTKAPGAYIVQCRGAIDGAFRALLLRYGAAPVSYVPNNALLVRVTPEKAAALDQDSRVQAVLPYEPYYKIKGSLLSLLLSERGASRTGSSLLEPGNQLAINVLVFSNAYEEVCGAAKTGGTTVLSSSASPFGPVLQVVCARADIPWLACLPGVQELEFMRSPAPAMDLARVACGVSSNTITGFNHLGLSGSNASVCVLDTGVDANHPDLNGRVTGVNPAAAVDPSGHGTHVAGVIAGNGATSLSVTQASGSVLPPAAPQFRGIAPAAHLFSILATNAGLSSLESALETAALVTNTVAANCSWTYAGDNEYDLAAVICDAAARDALPLVSAQQPLLCVVAAGNSGGGREDGTGGRPNSIESPATAKNVITVGGLENVRWITNETWTCSETGVCQTNRPWLLGSDSANQVASFSSRGNVGIGTEGIAGRFKPDLLAPATVVVSARSGQWNELAYYSAPDNPLLNSPDSNGVEVLSNLNRSLGPFYRFESGTSVSAAQVSGILALMQEFFAGIGKTNSPALMKALLINGARPLPGTAVSLETNSQGWGRVWCPGALHASLTNTSGVSRSMSFFDQSPSNALATGQSQTRFLQVASAARQLPLRVTLVWSDPPGNPTVALKLVNDLDLVVTNLDTGDVFLGNNISAETQFSVAWTPGTEPSLDSVNNVEAVLLKPGLSGNYSVTVNARHVNMNAVSSRTDEVLQDFALVISSGDGEISDALSLGQTVASAAAVTNVTVILNQLAGTNTADVGAVLWDQRVGAGPPLLADNSIPLGPGSATGPGTSSQWRFYVFTNTAGYTNAAFATFLPARVGFAGAGLSTNSAAAPGADIDLYVSIDPGITNLDPGAIATASKSLARGGAESVLLSNAVQAAYYIGVKCESQSGAEYDLVAVFSDTPFSSVDGMGNQLLRGFPMPLPISTNGSAAVMCVAPESILSRRVIVTNVVSHPATRELHTGLVHHSVSAVLNNHSPQAEMTVYNDSREMDLPWAVRSDGPGSLVDFCGQDGAGPWLLMTASSNQPGTEESAWIAIERQSDLRGGVMNGLLPGACRTDFIQIPSAASNLVATANLVDGTGPVSFRLAPLGADPARSLTLLLSSNSNAGSLSIDSSSTPPIHPGTYQVTLCNGGPDSVQMFVSCTPGIDPQPRPLFEYISPSAMVIPDERRSYSSLTITNRELVESVNVGVRISHPEISDLVLRLVSPGGRSVLLQENRGGASREGMGADVTVTNVSSLSWDGGSEASTNMLGVGPGPGTVKIDYEFWSLPDTMRVYYGGALLFDSGLVSGSGSTNVSYPAGTATNVVIVMNESGNPEPTTRWAYTASSTFLKSVPLTFTENTNLASVPIKFAPAPLTNINFSVPGSPDSDGIFYLPEESLDAFAGEPAFGEWRLEITDTKAGPVDPPPMLAMWQLDFTLRSASPAPVPLYPGLGFTNLLASGQTMWFVVRAPDWASWATNRLLSATAPVDLLLDHLPPSEVVNAVSLLSSSVGGIAVLRTNATPGFDAGEQYYLGVRNTNELTVQFAIAVDFDVNQVVTLTSGVPFAKTNSSGINGIDFYRFVVSSNAVRAQFEINGPTENLSLFVRKGLPLPNAALLDYSSANPGTNDELIVVYDYSRPVALTPGEWYLGVMSLSAYPAKYSVMANEWAVHGTNLVVDSTWMTNGSYCLSWSSLPGIHYYIEGKTNLSDPNWKQLSQTLTATDLSMVYCIAEPGPYQYFRVCEGMVVSPAPLVIESINASSSGLLLTWNAEPDRRFQVEWNDSLAGVPWAAFTNVVTSATGVYQFLDDGSQSQGLGQTRFYRIQAVGQ